MMGALLSLGTARRVARFGKAEAPTPPQQSTLAGGSCRRVHLPVTAHSPTTSGQ